MLEIPEHIITQKVREGDKAAFKEAYLSFYNAVYYFVSRYIENPDTVEDITQESFFQLWKHRERLNHQLGYKSYLLSIAKNRILNHLRSYNYHKKYKETVIKNTSEQLKGNNFEDNVFNRIENSNLLNIVYNEIQNLPQKQKDVIILSKIKHLTNKEIAEELNISIKTVEYRMMCALRKIRKIIEC